VELWIQVASVVVAALAIIVSGVWQLGKSETRVTQRIADHQEVTREIVAKACADLQKTVSEKVSEIYRDMERDRTLTNTAIVGIRQALSDLEIKSLEKFEGYVKRDSFYKFIDTLTEARNAFEKDMRERMGQIQAQLNRLVERDNARP